MLSSCLLTCQIIGDSIAFALGLATTLALLGVGASFAGKAYGQIGQGLPVAASALAVIMGLNLLEVEIAPCILFNANCLIVVISFLSALLAPLWSLVC